LFRIFRCNGFRLCFYSVGESAAFLGSSPYIRDMALMVIAYGMSINIVEVTWKSKLKAAFPNPNDYSAFMGNFSSATGVVTFLMMIAGEFVELPSAHASW
jgi:AAA family ATP:ADP antiporter